MKLEDGRISPYGLTILAIGFLAGSSLMIVPGQAVKQDTWATLGLGMVEGMAVSLVYCGLAARMRPAGFPQICKQAYGRLFGPVVAVLYLWFLFHLGSLVMTNLEDFVSVVMLLRTPQSVIVAVLIIAVTVVVRYGLSAIARVSQAVMPYVLVSLGATILMLIPDYRLSRLMPVLTTPLPKLLLYGHITASFPFNEAVAFMMVLPYVKGKPGSRAMFPALLVAGVALILAALRNTAALGALRPLQVYSSYGATRLIDLANFFTRLESLVAVDFLGTAFLKICVLLFGVSLGLSQLLGLKSYKPVVFPTGILMGALSLLNFQNVGENLAVADRGWPVYAAFFQIVIPAVTLLVVALRRLPGRERDAV